MRSYYGRPVIKEPVWTWEIPTYFFTGGLGGAAAVLSLVARAAGNQKLGKTATYIGAAADLASPPLLDLRPRPPGAVPEHDARRQADLADEHRQLGAARLGRRLVDGGAARAEREAEAGQARRRGRRSALRADAGDLHRDPAREHRRAGLARGPQGAAVRLRRERRRERGRRVRAAAAAARGRARRGGSRSAASSPRTRSCSRWRSASASSASRTVEGTAGKLAWAAKAATSAGAALLGLRGRRSRAASVLGSALVLGGEVALRWSVFKAGFQSARDPRYTVEPQRARRDERERASG